MAAVIPSSVSVPSARSGAPRVVVPRALVNFWRWWRAELRLVLVPLQDKYWVDRTGTLDLSIAADGQLALPPRLNGRDVRLVLDGSHVLQKTVTYPAAVEESLAEVILHDLDRQTPFTAEQIYLIHRVERRYESGDGVARIDVELTMVMRRVVATAIQRVREAGGAVYSAVIRQPAGNTRELLSAAERAPRRLSALQKINLGLLCLLVGLIVAAAAVPILQRHAQVIELAPRMEKARGEAEATRKIEAEFQRLSREYQLAMTKKYQSYAALDIIEELTRLSPDTTWLQSLELRAPSGAAKPSKGVREVQVIGEATTASKMIELLEQSPLLQNTTQRAQTTRGTQPNTERFQIAAELRPRVVPEKVDLSIATPVVADAPAAPAPPREAPIEVAKVTAESPPKADKVTPTAAKPPVAATGGAPSNPSAPRQTP